jgi:cation-transporting ATPase 13A3/4/5
VQVTYLNSGLRQLLTYWTLNVLSLGIVYLMVRWFLHFRLWLCYRVCNLDDMTHVFVVKLINGVEDTSLITDVAKKELHLGTTIRTTVPLLRLSKVFTFELIQFYFDANIIKPLRNNLSTLTHQEIIKSTHQAPRETLKSTYGENKMDLPVQSIGSLLIEEVLSPFNVFQVFALALWAYDDYAMYACLIGVITLT